jgi:hypothetical protein
MTIMSLPYSSTVQFLPISSRPPRGMIFSFSAKRILLSKMGRQNGRNKQATVFQNPALNRLFCRKTPAKYEIFDARVCPPGANQG